MKQILTLSFIAVMGLNFCGCDDTDDIEVKSVDYYSTHRKIAKERYQECKKMEKRTKNIQKDCENASLGYGKTLD